MNCNKLLANDRLTCNKQIIKLEWPDCSSWGQDFFRGRSLCPKMKCQATLTWWFVYCRSTCSQRAVCRSSLFKIRKMMMIAIKNTLCIGKKKITEFTDSYLKLYYASKLHCGDSLLSEMHMLRSQIPCDGCVLYCVLYCNVLFMDRTVLVMFMSMCNKHAIAAM